MSLCRAPAVMPAAQKEEVVLRWLPAPEPTSGHMDTDITPDSSPSSPWVFLQPLLALNMGHSSCPGLVFSCGT